MIREVFGSTETVELPDLGLKVVAKVDTGAWSGALHCTSIHEKDGALYFTPIGKKSLATSVTNFELRNVKSASGHTINRYLIPLTVKIKNKTYSTVVGLSNRSSLQKEMLIGRRFLIENKILVDVTLTMESDYEAEKYL